MLLLGVLLGGLKAALVARRMGWWHLIPRCPSLRVGRRGLQGLVPLRFTSARRLKNGALKTQKRPELIYLINSGR